MERDARALHDIALMSLPMGTPLVIHSSVAQLYGLRDKREVVAVELDEDFPDAILKMVRCNQPLWKRVSDGGERVRERHS